MVKGEPTGYLGVRRSAQQITPEEPQLFCKVPGSDRWEEAEAHPDMETPPKDYGMVEVGHRGQTYR